MYAGHNRMHSASEDVGIDLLWKGQVEADLYLLHIQQESWEMSFSLLEKTGIDCKRSHADVARPCFECVSEHVCSCDINPVHNNHIERNKFKGCRNNMYTQIQAACLHARKLIRVHQL